MTNQAFQITSLLTNDAPPNLADRRQEQRYVLRTAVAMRHESNLSTGMSEDIGEEGMFIATPARLAPGTQITVHFVLPSRNVRISIRALVEWVRAGGTDASDSPDARPTPPGVGVRFLALDEAALRSIRAFIQLRKPPLAPRSSSSDESRPSGIIRRAIAPTPPPLPPRVKDRRLAPRYLLSAAVTPNGDNNFYAGLSEDISDGGLFIATCQRLPVGTPVLLRITLPTSSEPIQLRATVHWVRGPEALAHAPRSLELAGV